MPDSFFFTKDNNYAERNSVGALLVVQNNYGGGILFFCEEYDQFWKKLEDGALLDPTGFRKPDFRPATLQEIIDQGYHMVIDGVTGTDGRGQRCSLKLPK